MDFRITLQMLGDLCNLGINYFDLKKSGREGDHGGLSTDEFLGERLEREPPNVFSVHFGL